MVALQLPLLASVAGAAHASGNYSTGSLPHFALQQLKGQFGVSNTECAVHKAGSTVKDSIDHESIMNPIRNQGQCGSCYIFAAVAVMESATRLDLGKEVEISEQQSVDCAAKDFDPLGSDVGGCGAGITSAALSHYTETGADNKNPAKCVCSRKSYEYLGDTLLRCDDPDYDKSTGDKCWHQPGADGEQHRKPILQTCQVDDCECVLPAGSVENCYQIPPTKGKGHVAALKEALNHRPIAININGDPLNAKELQGGNYNKVFPAEMVKCGGGTTDHAVVAVGYGTDTDGTEYWKIRNSWDTEWGDKGYLRMAIVDDDEGSLCLNTDSILGVYPKMTKQEPPTPKPTPTPPLDYPVCAEVDGQVKYDWAGQSSHRTCCCNGCDYDTCEQKILDGTADGHCYTQAQVDAGKVGNGWAPRGCNYGSADNTCAFDDNDQCVYSDAGSSISV